TTNMVPTVYDYDNAYELYGQTWIWRENEYCCVLMGYNQTKGTVILADPMHGIVEYDMFTFYDRYIEQYESALVIEEGAVLAEETE
ncbi:MAG: hypothetical protein K6B75_02505, partial [Lachnospiraceae bacterium]|nr:hypothetical protein [Lachnospiraceae bacterium]